MATERTYTDVQLLQLTATDGLTLAQIERRGALCRMQAESVDLQKRSAENRKYLDEQEQKQRQHRAKLEDIERSEADDLRIKTSCKHMTGGRGREGIFNGTDDAGYGYCVSRQQLPNGFVYGLCFRCQREWHDPKTIMRWFEGQQEQISLRKAVTLGLFPLDEYLQMEHEFRAMLGWKAKTFEGATSEIPSSVQFVIPALKERMDREAKEFQEYLLSLPPKQLEAAKLSAMGAIQ